MSVSPQLKVVCASLVIWSLGVGHSHAQVIWDGSSGDNLWTTGANWSTGSAPGSGSPAQFDADGLAGGGYNISLNGGNRTVNSVTFVAATTASGFDFTTNQVRIGSGGLSNLDDQQQRFQNIRLESNQTWSLNGGLLIDANLILRRNLTLNETGGGAGAIDIDGRLQLGGSRTLTINTSGGVTADILRLNGSQLTLAGTGDLTIDQRLENHNGNRTFINNGTGTVTMAGARLSNNGTNRTLTIGGTNDTLITGEVENGSTSTSNLTYSGTGTLTLAGDNTYTGDTTISSGILQIGDGAGGSTGSLLSDVSNSGTLRFDRSGSVTYSNVLSGAGALEIASVDLTMSGTNTSFTGTIDVTDGGVLDISAEENLGSLSANANLTLNDGTLRVSGGVTVDNDGNDRDIVLGAGGGTIDTVTGSDTLIWDNLITGSGNLTKTGDGTLRLQDPNTFTGDFDINAGTVELATNNAIADTVAVTVASGATFDIDGRTETIGSLSGAGTVTNTGGGDTLTVGANNTNTTFSGIIEDDIDLVKSGTGNLTLSGANTHIGTTSVNAGTLTLANDSALGTTASDTTVASGATLAFTNNISVGAEDIDNDGTVSNVSGTNTYAGNLTGTGDLQVQGGSLTLTGDASHSGGTTISAGTLQIGNGGTSGSIDGNITNNSALVFNRSDNITYNDVISGTGSLEQAGLGSLTLDAVNTYTGATTINAGQLRLNIDNALSNSTAVTIASGAAFDLDNNSDTVGSIAGAGNITLGSGSLSAGEDDTSTVFSGVISESGSFTKTGTGTLTLSGSNTYTGTTTISEGILALGASNVLSDSTALNIGASGTLNVDGNFDNVGSLAGSGSVTLGSGTLGAGSDNTSTTFSGVISGTGGLNKNGTGTLTLSGTNTYTGTTTINNGTLQLGASNVLADSTTVSSGASGTLDLNGNSETIGALVGDGSVTLGAGTLTTGAGASSTYSGVISGSGSLIKEGSSTFTLDGSNTYTGGTTVNAGTLTLATGGSTGAIRGELTVNSGGTVSATATDAFGYGAGNKVTTITVNGGTIENNIAATNGNLGWDNDWVLSNGATLTSNGGTASTTANPNFTMGNGSTVEVTAGTATIAGRMNLRGDGGNTTTNFTVADGATLDVTAGVTNSNGDSGITKLGTGEMILGFTNTYVGGTNVNAGTLTLSADNALGDSSNSTTVASGGTLALTGGIDVAQTGYTLAGTGVGGTAGAIQNVSGDNRLTGDFTLSADTTIQATAGTLNVGTFWDIAGFFTATDTFDTAGNTLTFDGAGNTVLAAELDGSGNVIKNGTGTLTFENSRNRDWTGTTTINDGELISRNLFNNGTPGAPGTANYTFNDTVTIGDGTGAAGSATLTIGTNDRGAGFNHKNAFADGVDLVINSDGRFNTRGHEQYVQDVTLDGGTIDAWTNANAVVESLFITGSITATESSTINGKIDLNGDAAKVIDVQDSGETLDITALIDNGGFDKQGDGILELSGVNTYTGNVDISEGIVLLESNSGLGAVAGSTNVDSGAQLQLSGVTVGAEALTLNGSGISSDGALQTVASSGANSWAGSVTLASATEIEVSSGSSLTISGNITGSGQTLTVDGPGNSTFTGTDTFNTLNKTGSGTLTLSSNTKTVSTINVSGGTLDLGTSDIIANTADLNISGTGTFTMGGGINETIDQFTQSNGTLDVDGVLTLNGGTISGGDGSGSSGTMVLTAGNTLNITNDYDFGGTLELTAGTTLALSGASTIDIGTLNITGNTVIDFGADANTLNLGALTIAGGVSVTVNNWISFQDLWTTGSFQGGSGSVTIDERDSNTAQITFSGFSPSDTIWLTFDFGSNEITVPEPGTYGATLMAFGLALWTIRRRPRKAVK